MIAWPVTVEEGAVTVEVPDAVYPIAAIHGAAVLKLDQAWVRLENGEGRTRIVARPKAGANSPSELEALGGAILNELLHQALRLDVGARTEKLRELVIGKAVMAAETPVEEPVQFVDDPLGIGRPWSERGLK